LPGTEQRSKSSFLFHRRGKRQTKVMDRVHIRILVVDDHAIVRTGLAAVIETEPDMAVVGQAATGKQAVSLFKEMKPDVTIMDLTLTPDMTGIQAIQVIRS